MSKINYNMCIFIKQHENESIYFTSASKMMRIVSSKTMIAIHTGKQAPISIDQISIAFYFLIVGTYSPHCTQ